MLFFNKSWKQHLTKRQFHEHMTLITQTTKLIKKTWLTCNDKLISDVLWWNLTYPPLPLPPPLSLSLSLCATDSHIDKKKKFENFILNVQKFFLLYFWNIFHAKLRMRAIVVKYAFILLDFETRLYFAAFYRFLSMFASQKYPACFVFGEVFYSLLVPCISYFLGGRDSCLLPLALNRLKKKTLFKILIWPTQSSSFPICSPGLAPSL